MSSFLDKPLRDLLDESLEVPRKGAGQLDEQGTSPVVGKVAAVRNKWTPGPWTLRRNKKYRTSVSGKGWREFAKVVVRMSDADADIQEGIANAALIAAAPDLYEALEALVETAVAEVNEKGGAGGSHLARLTDARAALSKARGEA